MQVKTHALLLLHALLYKNEIFLIGKNINKKKDIFIRHKHFQVCKKVTLGGRVSRKL